MEIAIRERIRRFSRLRNIAGKKNDLWSICAHRDIAPDKIINFIIQRFIAETDGQPPQTLMTHDHIFINAVSASGHLTRQVVISGRPEERKKFITRLSKYLN